MVNKGLFKCKEPKNVDRRTGCVYTFDIGVTPSKQFNDDIGGLTAQ